MQSPDDECLEFVRDRSTKAPLKTKAGVALRSDALLPFLGSTSEQLFVKLFRLDLEALMDGGKSILDASDDVGQLLFQSAAGISSLGALKSALDQEADALFAPRGSSDRAVHVAIDQHEAAKSALKAVMVNTKTWAAIDAEVTRLDDCLGALDKTRRGRVAESRKLERIRRLAHLVARMRDLQSQIDELGQGPEFPEGSSRLPSSGLETLASQNATVDFNHERVLDLAKKLESLQSDDAVLKLEIDIERLAADAQRAVGQRRDLVTCESDVKSTLERVADSAAELGWPVDEAALRAAAPTSLALKTVSALLTERGALEKQAAADAEAQLRAEAALQRLRSRHEEPGVAPVSQAFKAALRDARALGQAKERIRDIEKQVATAQGEVESAMAALGDWRMEPAAPRLLQAQTVDRLNRPRTRETELELAVKTARKGVTDAGNAHRSAERRLTQYQQSHQVVLLEDVIQARTPRDAAWTAVKSCAVSLEVGAADVERTMHQADNLVDTQRDTAEKSARFRSARNAHRRPAWVAGAPRHHACPRGRPVGQAKAA